MCTHRQTHARMRTKMSVHVQPYFPCPHPPHVPTFIFGNIKSQEGVKIAMYIVLILMKKIQMESNNRNYSVI